MSMSLSWIRTVSTVLRTTSLQTIFHFLRGGLGTREEVSRLPTKRVAFSTEAGLSAVEEESSLRIVGFIFKTRGAFISPRTKRSAFLVNETVHLFYSRIPVSRPTNFITFQLGKIERASFGRIGTDF